MILIAGGTGMLGTQVVSCLTRHDLPIRILTRDPARARHLESDGVEIALGDVRDPDALKRAMDGVRTVISAVHGFAGTGKDNPRTIDGQGNSNLIAAARTAGVEHFILLSIQGATPDHPIEMFRMKSRAEQELRASGLTWTIIRPTAFMETWGRLIGEPLVTTGKTRVFGRGDNPINFISVHDVARFVELSVTDPALQGVTVDVGGPENLSMKQLAETFEKVTGRTGAVSAVPRPMMRVMSVLLRPINPTMARQIQAGVVMDIQDMTFDPSALQSRFPSIPLTDLAGVVRRDYAG